MDLISFTGSTAIGRRIMSQGSATVKKCFLELGGKSANIVLEDPHPHKHAAGYRKPPLAL